MRHLFYTQCQEEEKKKRHFCKKFLQFAHLILINQDVQGKNAPIYLWIQHCEKEDRNS